MRFYEKAGLRRVRGRSGRMAEMPPAAIETSVFYEEVFAVPALSRRRR